MSTKKRTADMQLTKDDDSRDEVTGLAFESEVIRSGVLPAMDSKGGFGFGACYKINPFTAVTSTGVNGFGNTEGTVAASTSEIIVTASEVGVAAVPTAQPSFGFGAYANSNPFATVAATLPPFASGASSSSGAASSTFGSASSGAGAGFTTSTAKSNPFAVPLTISLPESANPPVTATAVSASTFTSMPNNGSSFSSYTTKAPLAVIIPSPHTLSPKAQNPFSNPSPKHNPFVTIVESKDNLWSAASRNSSSTCTSTTGIMSGPSSFPFPSADVSSSKSINTLSTSNYINSDSGSDKNVFGNSDNSVFGNTENNVFGSSAPSSRNVGNGDDDDTGYAEDQVYGKIYPMPDNVTVVTGEENEDCLIQIRAKLFRLSVPSDNDKLSPISSSGSSGNLLSELIPVENIRTKTQNNGDNDEGTITKVPETDDDTSHPENSESDKNKDKEKETTQIIEKNEKKTKAIGEWIEVGIGPVRILKQREAPLVRGENNLNKISSNNVSKRMVMRREDKKGGKGTKLLLNTLLKGYIIVKKQGDRTFHLTCLSENYSAVGANNNSCTDSTQGPGLDLSTYMIQTKQPQEADRLFEAISSCVSQDRRENLPPVKT